VLGTAGFGASRFAVESEARCTANNKHPNLSLTHAVSTATVSSATSVSSAVSFEDVLNNNNTAAAAQQQQQQQQQQPPQGMTLRIAACCLPHPEKAHYGGEDAFFVSAAGGGALGVADGVGGWAESGVNPAAYSRTLMRVACAFIEGAEGEALARAAAEGPRAPTADASMGSMDADSMGDDGDAAGGGYAPYSGGGAVVAAGAVSGGYVDPRAALDAAHRRTRCAGSATACVVQLDGARRRLVAANLVRFFLGAGGGGARCAAVESGAGSNIVLTPQNTPYRLDPDRATAASSSRAAAPSSRARARCSTFSTARCSSAPFPNSSTRPTRRRRPRCLRCRCRPAT
jgi:hypothetical protein